MAEPEINNIWRDGPYLVVRHRTAKFPKRCIICGDDQDCRQISCRVRKRPGLLPIFIWVFGVFSPCITIAPYACSGHRRREILFRIVGYVILLIGVGMLAAGTVLAFRGQENRTMYFFLAFAPLIIWIWVFYRIYRRRLLYANYIKQRVGWIEDVHESILNAAPPLPD